MIQRPSRLLFAIRQNRCPALFYTPIPLPERANAAPPGSVLPQGRASPPQYPQGRYKTNERVSDRFRTPQTVRTRRRPTNAAYAPDVPERAGRCAVRPKGGWSFFSEKRKEKRTDQPAQPRKNPPSSAKHRYRVDFWKKGLAYASPEINIRLRPLPNARPIGPRVASATLVGGQPAPRLGG